ncbi:ectoine/hydroxyectoine ABC transporter substrate-binding protein EhuB [Lignipirellula cremea]|uniref:Lysine-arginine-ornithine-binding periplasmic protein n=1 Tax=Lignipirellula cremea TaxID=2528010 RepID=A0A518DXW7_9BACT|nr:ectoine/hydroxyectoine ABC transporter substrate-binding protein EhuB [Lignipirellula cremea]QDU96689.1 Lysine-arginine-ornithine-binding periplasmic protein precursor [Lignipirellula cremea]
MPSDRRRAGPLGFGLIVLLASAVGVVAYGSWSGGFSSSANQDTLEQLRETGVVRIGYANEAPYGYLDTARGEITGEAPEIARYVLHEMGAKRVESVVTEFGSLIPGLKAGRFDVIAAGMYITPSRCREIAFSDPTYCIGEAFVVQAGNPLDLHSFEDVAATEAARIGVVGGAIEDSYAQAVGVPEGRIVRFPDNISALTGVWTGRIDAFAATALTVHDLVQKADSPLIERATPFSDPVIDGVVAKGYGAFGFRQQDAAFRREFNQRLRLLLGTEKHLKLVGKFGINEETLPGGRTAEDLCQGEQEP